MAAPPPPPPPPPGAPDARGLLVASGRYALGAVVGRGSFGCVHRVADLSPEATSQRLVAKCEREDAAVPQLAYERRVMRLLEPAGVPPVVWAGVRGGWRVLVMHDRGVSLEELRCRQGGRLAVSQVCAIGARLVRALEKVHDLGVVHRDLKPENVLVGGTDARLTLIDFGLSKKYTRRDGAHIACTRGAGLRGTPRYVSLNVHGGLPASRRDDLESALYVLSFLSVGTLPWAAQRAPAELGTRARKRERNRLIGQAKMRSTLREAMGPALPAEFTRALRAARNLRFEERPDYAAMREAFLAAHARAVARPEAA